MERSAKGVDPSEVRFMLEPALPQIEEAARTFPADQHMQKLADLVLRNCVKISAAFRPKVLNWPYDVVPVTVKTIPL